MTPKTLSAIVGVSNFDRDEDEEEVVDFTGQPQRKDKQRSLTEASTSPARTKKLTSVIT